MKIVPEFEQSPGDSRDIGAQHATVHGVAKNRTQLKDWKATTTKLYLPKNKKITKDLKPALRC